jgi:hypothetical protein
MGGKGGREMKRDMTEKQFLSACARYGFKRQGFMGYYDVGNGLHVSVLNAGMRRRDWLSYLIRESEKAEERKAII